MPIRHCSPEPENYPYMQSSQQLLAFADKFQKYTFYQLIDKQESFKLINKELISFHKKWRDETGATHGGIQGHHRELIWALLKILPASMENIRNKHPRKFRNLLSEGRFVIQTTKSTLLQKMADKNISVGERTVFNLIDRLIEAGVIIRKKAMRMVGTEIELNPKLIVLYLTQEETNLLEQAEAENNSIEAELAPSDSQDGAEALAAGDPPLKCSFFPIYINPKGDTEQKEKKEVGAVFETSSNRDKISKKEVRSGAGATDRTPEMCLLMQLVASVFNNRPMSDETRRAALDLLKTHLEAARGVVEDWRAGIIAKVKKTAAYQNSKNKERFLLNFQKKLPNADNRAFEIVSSAIQIQSEYLERKQYKLYMNPVKYLSNKFFVPMKYAVELVQKQMQHPIDNTVYHAHLIVQAEVFRAVLGVTHIFQQSGPRVALEYYAHHYGRIVGLLESETCKDLTPANAETYLKRLKNQLQHLFDEQTEA